MFPQNFHSSRDSIKAKQIWSRGVAQVVPVKTHLRTTVEDDFDLELTRDYGGLETRSDVRLHNEGCADYQIMYGARDKAGSGHH